MEVQFDEEEGPRAVRQSTKVKTINADMARERRDAEQKHKSRPPVQRVKAMFDQDDMLREALQTEVTASNPFCALNRMHCFNDTNRKFIQTLLHHAVYVTLYMQYVITICRKKM